MLRASGIIFSVLLNSRCIAGNSWHAEKGSCLKIFAAEEVKNTKNTVILVSAGSISGAKSRQTAQSELYARTLARLGCTAVHDAGYGNAALLAERMDALVLSGGGDIHPLYYGKHLTGLDTSVDPHRDEREWELMRWFCAKKKPILGICRGMQVVDVFFGGTLFRHLGTAHVHDNTLHTIITAESGRLRPLLGEKLAVNSYHHQAIRTLGAGLHVTAVSDADGVIEAIEHDTLPIMAVQWHPERMIDGLCQDAACDMIPLFAAFLALPAKKGTT